LGYPSYLDVLPRFGTLRNFKNPTYGPRLAKIHRLLTRKQPMPWQQYFYDVFGEVDAKTGLRVYREALVTTMRQCGKSTVLRVAKVHRALDASEPQLIQFAAQNGIEAKRKWLAQAEQIKKTPLGARLAGLDEPVTSNGKELLTWWNGSTEFPLSGLASAGHGDSLDLGAVTEAFSQIDYRYEDNMLPAMYARPDAQYLAESTMGTALSLYWNERIGAQRERLEAEPTARGRVMLVDYSFDEDNDDVDAPETWLQRIPAIGHTIRLEEVQHAHDTAITPAKRRQFLRGTGNVADLGAVETDSIDADAWASCLSPKSRITGQVQFGLDIAPDRSWASVGIAGESTAGGIHIGLAQHDRDTRWVVEYLVRKTRQFGTDTVYVAARSQADAMTKKLEKAGLTVVVISRAEITAACAGLYDDIIAGDIVYRPGQTALDAAVGGAIWTGGDTRIFDRGSSVVDISPLYAVTLARFAHTTAEESIDVLDTIA
jgi:phage terminase large subunit-like protein